MRILIGIIGILVASAVVAEEDYYVWVDEDGVTNYSERNPQGQSAQHVTRGSRFGTAVDEGDNRRPGAASTPDAEQEATQETASNDDGNQGESNAGSDPQDLDPDAIAKEREAIQAKINETKRTNCEIGKKNLAQLEAFARVSVTGEDGQQRMLSEEEHQQQIQQARQLIRENCDGA